MFNPPKVDVLKSIYFPSGGINKLDEVYMSQLVVHAYACIKWGAMNVGMGIAKQT